EAVFVMRGVVVAHDLPPITNRKQLPDRAHWAKQAVSIVGLGAPHFTRAAGAILGIHQRMSALFRDGDFKKWQADFRGDHVVISLTNRYITLKEQVDGQPAVPFPEHVDPLHILRDATARHGVHTEDNDVLYYVRDANGRYALYKEVDPAVFRAGQVVEVQFSFASVPLSGRTHIHQMILKMRSLALLDRGIQEVSPSNTCYCVMSLTGPGVRGLFAGGRY
ncbi:hypothetical protein FA95DRAFT_1501742, partial [Auriscalpium vulgare]